MGGVVDDIVNPVGAITGVDPVKDATGFTGTSFGPTKAQQQAAAAGQGGQQQGVVSGGSGPPPSSGQFMQQFDRQQNQPFAQFGQQLHQLAAPQTSGIGNITSPSAQSTAAAVTANAVQARQYSPYLQPPQGPSQFWQSMWA